MSRRRMAAEDWIALVCGVTAIALLVFAGAAATGRVSL